RERGDGRWGGPLEDIDPAEEHAEEVAEHMDHECDCPYCLGQAPQQPLHEATAVEQARALLAGTSHAVVPVTHLNASQRRIAELEEQVGRMVEGGWVDPDVLREQGRAALLEAMVGRVDGDEQSTTGRPVAWGTGRPSAAYEGTTLDRRHPYGPPQR